MTVPAAFCGSGRFDVHVVVHVRLDHRGSLPALLAEGLHERPQVRGFADEVHRGGAGADDLLRERSPVRKARDRIGDGALVVDALGLDDRLRLVLDRLHRGQVTPHLDHRLGRVGIDLLELAHLQAARLSRRMREGLHLSVGFGLLRRGGEGRDLSQVALVEVRVVLAAELEVVLDLAASDHHEHAVAGDGHGVLHLEQLAVEIHELDLQSTDSTLGVAPVGESDRGVPQLLVESRTDGRGAIVGNPDQELVGAPGTLVAVHRQIPAPARRLHVAEGGGARTLGRGGRRGAVAVLAGGPVGVLGRAGCYEEDDPEQCSSDPESTVPSHLHSPSSWFRHVARSHLL